MTDRTTAPSSRTHHRLRRTAAFAAVVALGAAGLAACSDDKADKVDAGTTSTTSTTTTDSSADGGSNAGGGSGNSGGNSSGGSNGGNSGGGSGGGSSSTAPAFTNVSTPDSIDCHNGDFQEFTASWTTTNATRVTVSIDGPGVYNEYPANGEASLPFNCSSSHTFLFTAYNGDGATATKSITLQPRNAQSASTETTDTTEP